MAAGVVEYTQGLDNFPRAGADEEEDWLPEVTTTH